MLESTFQSTILKFLRSQGAFAMKVPQNSTTLAGVSDIVFFKEQFYGFIEVKQSQSAKRRPGQEVFVKKMDAWSYARVVWPGECWEKVRKELKDLLR